MIYLFLLSKIISCLYGFEHFEIMIFQTFLRFPSFDESQKGEKVWTQGY